MPLPPEWKKGRVIGYMYRLLALNHYLTSYTTRATLV